MSTTGMKDIKEKRKKSLEKLYKKHPELKDKTISNQDLIDLILDFKKGDKSNKTSVK